MTDDVGTILIELLSSFYWILLRDKVEMDCEIRCNDVVHFMYD